MKKILLLGLVSLLGIVFWVSSNRDPDAIKIKAVEKASATAIIEAAKRVYEVGKNDPDRSLRQLMAPTDGMGFRDYANLLATLPAPDFSRAEVGSPVTDPRFFYVLVPIPGEKRKFQFTLKNQDNQLLLAGVNWSLQ